MDNLRIAIVGSREWKDYDVIRKFVDSLPADCTVVSGGARGVDSMAIRCATRRNLATHVYLPNWHPEPEGVYDPQAGFKRNQVIVDDVDLVVAFWDGISRGTRDTVLKAEARGLEVRINPVVWQPFERQLSLWERD